MLQKIVDCDPNATPPLVEKELSAFVAFLLNAISDEAVGADRYDNMDELICPFKDDVIVLVCELVVRINKSA